METFDCPVIIRNVEMNALSRCNRGVWIRPCCPYFPSTLISFTALITFVHQNFQGSWLSIISEAQNNGPCQLWVETSKSMRQNKYFLIQAVLLRHIYTALRILTKLCLVYALWTISSGDVFLFLYVWAVHVLKRQAHRIWNGRIYICILSCL